MTDTRSAELSPITIEKPSFNFEEAYQTAGDYKDLLLARYLQSYGEIHGESGQGVDVLIKELEAKFERGEINARFDTELGPKYHLSSQNLSLEEKLVLKIERAIEHNKQLAAGKGMLISVAIPAYNEADNIVVPLKNIHRQRIDDPVQVIVSDNGSTDETVTIAKGLGANIATGSEHGLIGSARKVGFQQAFKLETKIPTSNQLLVSTDADTVLAESFLHSVSQAYMKDPTMQASTGPIKVTINGVTFIHGPTWTENQR